VTWRPLAACWFWVVSTGLLAYAGLGAVATIWSLLLVAWFAGASGEIAAGICKQLRAGANRELRDRRPPVLYLRSFGEDGTAAPEPMWPLVVALLSGMPFIRIRRTFEQDIEREFKNLGPLVALNRPEDELPELGAHRVAAGPEGWQRTVEELLNRAALVIVRAGDSPSLLWEIQLVFAKVPRHRIVLFLQIGDDTNHDIQEIRYRRFRETVAAVGIFLPAHRNGRSLLMFDRFGEPRLMNTVRQVREAIQGLGSPAVTDLELGTRYSVASTAELRLVGGVPLEPRGDNSIQVRGRDDTDQPQ
jgi:hypothetical protein